MVSRYDGTSRNDVTLLAEHDLHDCSGSSEQLPALIELCPRKTRAVTFFFGYHHHCARLAESLGMCFEVSLP